VVFDKAEEMAAKYRNKCENSRYSPASVEARASLKPAADDEDIPQRLDEDIPATVDEDIPATVDEIQQRLMKIYQQRLTTARLMKLPTVDEDM